MTSELSNASDINPQTGRPIVRRPSKPAASKGGHESFLKALEASGTEIEIELASSGRQLRGKIKAADKYTISLMVQSPANADEYNTHVIFKHDISFFVPINRFYAKQAH